MVPFDRVLVNEVPKVSPLILCPEIINFDPLYRTEEIEIKILAQNGDFDECGL
jgi:hypothetical protein